MTALKKDSLLQSALLGWNTELASEFTDIQLPLFEFKALREEEASNCVLSAKDKIKINNLLIQTDRMIPRPETNSSEKHREVPLQLC